ncbi:hypothetical protein DM785_12875 [Deinococcus actinosclerus]|nr:hypothetical protein DM785_12875 [Deinococcus actinosclerus]
MVGQVVLCQRQAGGSAAPTGGVSPKDAVQDGMDGSRSHRVTLPGWTVRCMGRPVEVYSIL